MKTCTKCKIEKDLEQFHKDTVTKDGYAYRCKDCKNNYNKDYYKIDENKEKYNEYSKDYYLNNPEKFEFYIEKDKEKRFIVSKNWKKENRERYLKYRRDKVKEDLKDPLFNLVFNLRIRIYHLLKKQNATKKNSSLKYLGCSDKEYKQHLEDQFLPEFTWENYGKIWEVDHIIPLSKFDLTIEENIYKAFNYKNTKPRFKTTEIAESFGHFDHIGNRNKSNKIL